MVDVLEGDLLAQMHRMLHSEHIVLAASSDADSFRDEVDGARSRYNNCGRLLLPWQKWAAEKTAVQAYRESVERRKDPEHLAKLNKLQSELDAETKRIAGAVSDELQLRKDAAEHTKKLKDNAKHRRRRHVRVSRRRPKSAKRR